MALVRLIMTEHGIAYRARAPGQRSHRSSRRSHDLPRRLGKPVVGPRVTGEPLKPDAATRNADRPKGEKRKLASRLPGNSYGRFARCADGKRPRKRYLASRLSYLDHPFKNKPFETEKNLHPLLANTAEWAFLDAIWGIVWPVVPLPVVPLKHVDPPLYASRRESCTMVD